jgi:uncharacterized protein (DUF2236 family)
VVTADPYAGAAGLIARSAAAFASAVPEDPADEGYFGPGSIAWQLSGDLGGPVGGLRSLLLQALHPLAMAGVDQHSDWRRDPVGRLAATSAYLTTITFGDRATAGRAAARVRRVHEHVRGTDPVTGRPYAASDPALLLWVHATLVDSTLVTRELFGTPLPAGDADRYLAEMVAAAELVGIPRPLVPASTRDLERYIERMRPELQRTPAAAEAIGHLLDLPELADEIGEIWQDIRDGAIASLPEWARDAYGYQPAQPLTPQRQTEIRQALGVLDAAYLGEPGVLEARQRITLRARTAQRA